MVSRLFIAAVLFVNVVRANDMLKQKRVSVLPFPNVGYAPETNWYFGGVALVTARLFGDSLTRKSTFKGEANATMPAREKLFSTTSEHKPHAAQFRRQTGVII